MSGRVAVVRVHRLQAPSRFTNQKIGMTTRREKVCQYESSISDWSSDVCSSDLWDERSWQGRLDQDRLHHRSDVGGSRAVNAADPDTLARMTSARRRMFWAHQMRQWHWISAAICLVAMLLFAFTGITLNHAAQIKASPQISQREAQLPAALLTSLTAAPVPADAPSPAALRRGLSANLDELGRASCRARVCKEGYIPGVAEYCTKNKKKK